MRLCYSPIRVNKKWWMVPFLGFTLLILLGGVTAELQHKEGNDKLSSQKRDVRSATDGTGSSLEETGERDVVIGASAPGIDHGGEPQSSEELTEYPNGGHFMKFIFARLHQQQQKELQQPSSSVAYRTYLQQQQADRYVPATLSHWFYPTGGMQVRPGRADSNFIRFGRNFNSNLPYYNLGTGNSNNYGNGISSSGRESRSYSNNKKNNFIRLGRENPRQNNFIRLGRKSPSGFFDENENPRQNNFIRLGRSGVEGTAATMGGETAPGRGFVEERANEGEAVLEKKSLGANPTQTGYFPFNLYTNQTPSPLLPPNYYYWGTHSVMIPNKFNKH